MLDAVSTRRLAQRLGVEQPSLYHHFRKKEDLLNAMAEAAMSSHVTTPLPAPGDDWRDWFLENMGSFRRTLQLHRDGARLRTGTHPETTYLDRLEHKIGFVVESGVPERDVQLAMLTASRFAVGAALEEQADTDPSADISPWNPESAFEEGWH